MEVNHGCYTGSEPLFDSLRCVWAQAAGYGVHDFRNQGGPMIPRLDFDHFSEEDMCGEWPGGGPDDPLIIVLVHHERTGIIQWKHAPALAARLEELVSTLMQQNMMSWVLMTQQFVQGLKAAAHYQEDVVFQ
jgi:hypothetical protein